MWLLLTLALDAQAEPIEAWTRADFGESQALAEFDGWMSGYAADTWWGANGYAYALTDHNINDSGGEGYGSGWAADNWIVRGEEIRQGITTVLLANQDDDAIGIVACVDGRGSFYLAGHTSDSSPPGVEVQGSSVFLLKVDDGEPTLLGSERAELLSQDWSELGIRIDDDLVQMSLNGEVLIEAQDSSPLPPGQSGFYSYDAGYDGGGGGNTNVIFDSVSVHWVDEDGDLVEDDRDNCESTANADQEDHDDDGVGNECDPDWPPEDTDAPGDTGTEDERPPLDDDVTAALSCGCASGSPLSAWLPLLLAPLLLRRRR